MTTAIFGLVGVLLGGLITVGANYWLARRSESVDLRRASRLVSAELAVLQIHAEVMGERQSYPPASPLAQSLFPTQAWDTNKEVLAEHLKTEEWKRLSAVYAGVESQRIDLLVDRPTSVEFADVTVRFLDRISSDCEALQEVLAGYGN